MPKRGSISAGRRPAPEAWPVGTRRAQSGGAASAPRFTALSEEQWQSVDAPRKGWPNKRAHWRREIDQIGRDYAEAVDTRNIWLKKLSGKKPAQQKKMVEQALLSIGHLEKALSAFVENGLLDKNFPHPNLSHPEHCLNKWISDYGVWVQPFVGKSNPIQAEMEWRLIELWKKSGGKVAWSRTKEEGRTDTGRRATARDAAKRPNAPDAPLIDFLTLTLEPILGRTLKPSGIAKLIDRHRGRQQRHDPFLMFAMRDRIGRDT